MGHYQPAEDELGQWQSEDLIITEAERSMQRRGIRLQRAPDPVYVVVAQGDEKVTLLERAILDTKGRSINLHIHFCQAQVCPDPDAHREHWYYKSRLTHPDYGRYSWAYYCAACERIKDQQQ